MDILFQLKTLLRDPEVTLVEDIQSLWSGYGKIVRCYSPRQQKPFIVKMVAPQDATNHPRGWNTSTSHERKVMSYQVEANFYQDYSSLTDVHCKVPELLTTSMSESDNMTLLVMEDLNHSGYNQCIEKGTWNHLCIAIRWLAYFHAKFMGSTSSSLWPVGTYWHLGTRQDELHSMPEGDFKTFASAIDNVLNDAKYQTLVHGDAKFANLCFHENDKNVAAVDFQYIGKGSGVKDLAYLVGSCLDQKGLVEYGNDIVNAYLGYLKEAFTHYNLPIDFDELAEETKRLYPVAWADFYRFLLGWNPESWKICDYLKQQAQTGLNVVKHSL